jgi:Na+/proline symporter
MRVAVVAFTVLVLAYAISMQGSSIYELVSGAYQVPLVGAFVPLVCGLYWRRATTQGAIASVVLGLGVWSLFMLTPALAEAFPQQLAGLAAAFLGMGLGSLLPQWMADHKGHVHHFDGDGQATHVTG